MPDYLRDKKDLIVDKLFDDFKDKIQFPKKNYYSSNQNNRKKMNEKEKKAPHKELNPNSPSFTVSHHYPINERNDGPKEDENKQNSE